MGGTLGHPDHFIILDRLYGTLGDKLKHWTVEAEKCRGFMGRTKKKYLALHQVLWNERLVVMYNIARGMRYLHEHE